MLFTTWTMKSSQGPVRRICRIRPGTTSVTTKEKCQIDHGVRDTLKAYLKAHIIHSHGPTAGFWGARGKCGALVKKGKDLWYQKCCYNKLIMDLFLGGGREDEEKRRQLNGQTCILFFFPKLPFLDICQKNQHIHFLVHPMDPHSGYN